MRGFIGWLRGQPKYADLAGDAGAVGTLKQLILDMRKANACDEAWEMLYHALSDCPLPLPKEWHADMFTVGVPMHHLYGAMREYASPTNYDSVPLPRDAMESLCKYMIMSWFMDPEGTPDHIEKVACSSAQICRLYGVKNVEL